MLNYNTIEWYRGWSENDFIGEGFFMVATEERMKVVGESLKTKKTREKLKKRMDALEKKVTPQALKEKLVEIHRWISMNAGRRVVLRTKEISLFDENQNTAEMSRKIVGVAEQIQKEMQATYDIRKDQVGEQLLKKIVSFSREGKDLVG